MVKLSIKDVGLVVGYCGRFRDEEEHIERGGWDEDGMAVECSQSDGV